VVISQEIEYLAVVSSTPRLAPSSLDWTPATSALVLALTITVPKTMDPRRET
jgi:hypothetical protein